MKYLRSMCLLADLVAADDSTGYFVQPTVIVTKDPKSITMQEEIFGPVITVRTCHHVLYIANAHASVRRMCTKMKTLRRHSNLSIRLHHMR